MNGRTAENINILGRFCGMRDVALLTQAALEAYCGVRRADVMVLFGGSILAGGDVLARAIRARIARKYVIVGGAGHTTPTLREKVHAMYPAIETEGLPEAEVFARYIRHVHGVQADLLERDSTNCGNNITYLLALLEREKIPFRHIILCQDATMQRRMDAGMRKYAPPDVRIINYAAYRTEVVCPKGIPVYRDEIPGMWDTDRYIELLMGEIPRLTDGPEGYGPSGKGFIAHVDIPSDVQEAWASLRDELGITTRAADARFDGRRKEEP